jgi:hypothetical protein
MTAKYLLGSMYCGDTLLDVYGELSDPEPNLGYNGDIDIYDVRLSNTDVSVFEMIHSLNWEKFNDSAWEEFGG